MPQVQSHGGMSLIINGERVQGFADEDPPVEYDAPSLYEETRGADGALYVRGTNNPGGSLTVKLLPTSKDTARFMRYRARIQAGEDVPINGFYGDPRLGMSAEMDGGFLMTAPQGVIPPGTTAEFVFIFERITPNYDDVQL